MFQNTEFLLHDKRDKHVLILNEMHLAICGQQYTKVLLTSSFQ